MTENLRSTYTIRKARYAKNMIAIHCIPDGSGWKTLAALVISQMPGVRWSNRERAYLCSPGRAAKFEAEITRIQNKQQVEALIEDARTTERAIDHIDGDPTNNDLANLRIVTPRTNL